MSASHAVPPPPASPRPRSFATTSADAANGSSHRGSQEPARDLEIPVEPLALRASLASAGAGAAMSPTSRDAKSGDCCTATASPRGCPVSGKTSSPRCQTPALQCGSAARASEAGCDSVSTWTGTAVRGREASAAPAPQASPAASAANSVGTSRWDAGHESMHCQKTLRARFASSEASTASTKRPAECGISCSTQRSLGAWPAGRS